MRNINFKQPKYILPLLALPFLLLFFYVYKTTVREEKSSRPKQEAGIQTNIGQASEEVQKSGFSDKLDAFRNKYKEADGSTAINTIEEERGLDSIDQVMKNRFNAGPGISQVPYPAGTGVAPLANSRLTTQDRELSRALANLSQAQNLSPAVVPSSVREKDPMEVFRAQMAYMDSLTKSQDPGRLAEQEHKAQLAKAEAEQKSKVKLHVSKGGLESAEFNTLLPGKKQDFITAIIDESITGYAGSRIRLRLLEDIMAGNVAVKKGTYLYAEITGFSPQRVSLSVTSILIDGKILPVKLDLYDLDGLSGLYVPESAFREFTKDLGGNSMQGVNIQGNSQNQSQFLMSTIDKVFQSTSSAIASLIRKNKAKIKYSAYLYLIDPEALRDQQKSY